MATKNLGMALVAAALWTAPPAPSAQSAEVDTVVVEAAGWIGGGVLFREADRCYALTPWHLLQPVDSDALACSAKLTVVGVGQVEGSVGVGRVLAAFEEDDLALLLVSGSEALAACQRGAAWMRRDTSQALQRRTRGMIEYDVGAVSGAPARIPVDILQPEPDIIAKPQDDASTFEGVSGSVLQVGGQAVGMVLRVCAQIEPEKRCDSVGDAVAIPFSRVAEIIDPFLRAGGDVGRRVAACAAPDAGAARPSGALGGTVISWTTPLRSAPERGADGLVGAGPAPCFALPPGREVFEVVIELDAVRSLTRIGFDVSDLADLRQLARDVEVLTSRQATGARFSSLSTLRLLPSGENAKIFPERPVRRIMIRALGAQGHPSCLSLGRIVAQ